MSIRENKTIPPVYLCTEVYYEKCFEDADLPSVADVAKIQPDVQEPLNLIQSASYLWSSGHVFFCHRRTVRPCFYLTLFQYHAIGLVYVCKCNGHAPTKSGAVYSDGV